MRSFLALLGLYALPLFAQAPSPPLWMEDAFVDNTNRWDDDLLNDFYQRSNTFAVRANTPVRLVAEFDWSQSPAGAEIGLAWADKSGVFHLRLGSNREYAVQFGNSLIQDWKRLKRLDNRRNTLEMRREENNLSFWINGEQVYATKTQTPFAGNVLTLMKSNPSIRYEKFSLYQDGGKINVAESVKNLVAERENLGAKVNSKGMEKRPFISPDGKTLYFLRERKRDRGGEFDIIQDIWVSEWDEAAKTWREAYDIGSPVNNNQNNFMVAAMPDNQTIAVINSYTRDATGNELIALTRKQGSGWLMPQAVTVRNAGKQGRWLSLHLAADGKTLLFATKRFDSYGGRDVYVCFRQEDGSFTEPRNLGPTINTTGNEHCPFLAADGVTLYFDTDGHPGYGGRDIFLARRLDESWTRWSTPENLGPVFNSADSDEGFMTSAAGDFAYVVSSKDALGELDIFRIKIPEAVRPRPTALVQGRVVCAKAEEDLLVRVSQGGKELSTARLDARTKQYQLTLPSGAEYELQILGSTETYPPIQVDLRQLSSYETKVLGDWTCTTVAKPEPKPEPKPQPLAAPSSLRLPQILFATASAELLAPAKAALDDLAADLTKNPQVQIALHGHTDYRNTATYNQTLSDQRCQAVYDYLLSKGVAAERMSKAAFGRNKPLANNGSKEGMARNRRVEILITKGLSEGLKVEELGIPKLYNE